MQSRKDRRLDYGSVVCRRKNKYWVENMVQVDGDYGKEEDASFVMSDK